MILALIAVIASSSRASAEDRGSVFVSLPGPQSFVVRSLGKALTLNVSPDRDHGWDISVTENSAPDKGNLLYHSPEWHGPYPSQLFAWNIEFFSSDRWLCVYNHKPAYELHAVLKSYVIRGSGSESRFDRATLMVSWWERPCKDDHRLLMETKGDDMDSKRRGTWAGESEVGR